MHPLLMHHHHLTTQRARNDTSSNYSSRACRCSTNNTKPRHDWRKNGNRKKERSKRNENKSVSGAKNSGQSKSLCKATENTSSGSS